MSSPKPPRAVSADCPLRDARKKRNMTLKQIADLTGYSESAMSRIESGENQMGAAPARILYDLYEGEVPWTDLLRIPATTAQARKIIKRQIEAGKS